jgi:hypothetical protein
MTSEHFLPLFGAWRDVLWPDFGEHDGCVFCQKMDAAGEVVYENWMAQLGGDRRRVEEIMNHHHIADLIGGVVESPSHELILAVGRLLRELWTTKLARDFPDRKFVVSFPEDYSDDVVSYEITFYQAA